MDLKCNHTSYPTSRCETSTKNPDPQQPQRSEGHKSNLCTKLTGAPEGSCQPKKASTPTKATEHSLPASRHIYCKRQHKSTWSHPSSTKLKNSTAASDVNESAPTHKHHTPQESRHNQGMIPKSRIKDRPKTWRPSPVPYIAPHIRERRSLPYRELSTELINSSHGKNEHLQASIDHSFPESVQPRSKSTKSTVNQKSNSIPPETPCPSRISSANEVEIEVATVKMTTSEESDVVVLHRGSKTSNTDAEITPVPQKEYIHETRQCSLSPPQRRHAGGRVTSNVQQHIGQKATPASKENFSTDDEPVQEASPTSSKEEALEELNRLRAQIVRQAHLDRFKDLDYPTANPEILERCRSGPGTDPSSEFYISIKECRIAPILSASVPGKTALTSGGGHKTIKPSVSGAHKVAAQWECYERSPTVYPIVKDGELNLSSEPTNDHKLILAQLAQTAGLQGGTGGQNTGSGQERKHSWTDIYYANWEYYPHACSSSYEAFRDWFRRWLDGTIQICCYADIYHHAFFDGTAHPDGIRTMYIPDLEEQTTLLDMDDKESQLHCHETVQGYCHNWELHNKKERDEEQLRLRITREHYLEGLRNFPQPSASVLKENVYLRPVEIGDVPGLLEIFNWYAHNSPLSTYIEPLEAGDIRQCIDDSTEQKLPFIVAAERRIRATPNNGPQKILGYALATDYLGRRTSGRFTAELELFVKPGHTHKGIGKCLMDKLLEVCDPTYIPKRGYFFDCNTEERTRYWAGGQRRLGRLLFAISYPSDKRSTYSWIEEWLKSQYDFEEQGRLNGARVKFSHFLNVTYLVRNVGYHAGDRFNS